MGQHGATWDSMKQHEATWGNMGQHGETWSNKPDIARSLTSPPRWQQLLSGTKMAAQLDSGVPSAVLKDSRSFRPFKSSEEYLYAMKEDLAEWLNTLYPELDITVDNFMEKLETGVAICKNEKVMNIVSCATFEAWRVEKSPSVTYLCVTLMTCPLAMMTLACCSPTHTITPYWN
uniref:Uncharacterized protein n=1 Tax=Timema monikensis TaxID=170555 RepID=A0A7R9E2Y1_9NEOP|nr:unnamed protein product [Timema monikensis]